MKRMAVLGGICTSRAGHDKGTNYVIVKVLDAEFVAVSDGKYHKVAKPKKKRIKHLVLWAERVDDTLYRQILDGTVQDNEIHNKLKSMALS